ncbi:cadherin repeat domain-containing protein, partial [Nostoc punctiforme FACHB-252]
MALVPFSNEILVNNANTTTQQTPAIAIDSDGDYVVIWESVAQDDPTQTNRTGLFGQRFTFSGTKVGSEFQVNTVTNDNQGQPAVVYDPLSGFTVVWDSFGQDGSNYGVYSKRYNSAGVPQTGDSLVNTTTTGAQRDPVIARDATGNYVVVWRGNGSGGDSNGIYFQRFNAAGTALGGETLVNTASTDLETQPAVAMNGSGAFVVAYTSTNGTDSEVFVRLYNSSGIAVINPIQVNVTTTSAQNSPVVAIDNNGNFVVVWESSQNSAATAIDLYGRRFSSTGAALSGEFLISTVTAGNQSNAAIALDGNGNFTVAWQSVDQDGSGSGIYARQFSSAGVALGAEFLVNQTTAGDQVEPAIAMQTKGDFAIAWRNQSSGNGDIYVRSYSANNAPTGLTLSTTSINENVAANSVVANLSTIDPDIGDTFTYTLVTGTGSTDNSVFSIVDNQLRINSSPNFEAKNSYSIRVRTTDQRGLSFESPFTININNVNETPTAIALSAASINENVAANSVVGNFSTTDPDTGNTFTYSLVAGTGSTDNAAFSIVGNQLRINNSPDFETKSSYSIRVRTTDQGGLTFESPFTITVNDLAENTVPRALILSATNIDENVAANSVVANLSTIDPDIGDTFTYSLVAGTGSTDNAA